MITNEEREKLRPEVILRRRREEAARQDYLKKNKKRMKKLCHTKRNKVHRVNQPGYDYTMKRAIQQLTHPEVD